MRNITWILLLIVVIGQGLLSAAIVQTQRALVTAVYILQAGISLEQLEAMNAEYAARKDKHTASTDKHYTSPMHLAGNPGSTASFAH